ncbi:MAG: alkaline phosphatase family protein [Mycoplasmataceae bacterium]|nr:alkaline phosphatase family protein [Mycoplasmataceae bacterium]
MRRGGGSPYDFYQDESSHPEYSTIVNQLKEFIPNHRANFGILDCCDNAGHEFGFSPSVPEYVEALRQSDEYARELIDEARNSCTNPDENLLVVLTTDHGGINYDHGGFSDEETTTWYALSQSLFN